MKKCPYCAEEISKSAVFCKHCESRLEEAAVDGSRWEYIIATPRMKGWVNKGVSDEVVEKINDLGSEGWELISSSPVSTSKGGTDFLTLFFKRKIN